MTCRALTGLAAVITPLAGYFIPTGTAKTPAPNTARSVPLDDPEQSRVSWWPVIEGGADAMDRIFPVVPNRGRVSQTVCPGEVFTLCADLGKRVLAAGLATG